MQAHKHLLAGAIAGVLPDVVLTLFGWRKDWLPESHPLVKAHRFLHSPYGLLLPLFLGYLSHIVADRYSTHRTERNHS